MPPGEPIAPDRLEAFRLQRDQTLSELASRLASPLDNGLPSVTP